MFSLLLSSKNDKINSDYKGDQSHTTVKFVCMNLWAASINSSHPIRKKIKEKNKKEELWKNESQQPGKPIKKLRRTFS
ncbi:MAG: hypothetical protein MJ097_05975 [Dorea sp.]|nr:hypothetical protein [Dorea sp.]